MTILRVFLCMNTYSYLFSLYSSRLYSKTFREITSCVELRANDMSNPAVNFDILYMDYKFRKAWY